MVFFGQDLFLLKKINTYSISVVLLEIANIKNRISGMLRQKKWHKRKNSSKLQKNTTKRCRDSQPIRYIAQNTGYQDAPGTHWVLQQHKKDPGNKEGCIT